MSRFALEWVHFALGRDRGPARLLNALEHVERAA
jgi:hypothetical protein